MNLKRKTKKVKTASFGNHESRNVIERFFSDQKVIAFLALSFLILLSFPLAKTHSRRMMAEREIREMRSKIAEFENENKELTELIDYISSPQAAESQGRLSLNLKKPGEAVVVIERDGVSNEEQEELESASEQSPWKLWWSYFFK